MSFLANEVDLEIQRSCKCTSANRNTYFKGDISEQNVQHHLLHVIFIFNKTKQYLKANNTWWSFFQDRNVKMFWKECFAISNIYHPAQLRSDFSSISWLRYIEVKISFHLWTFRLGVGDNIQYQASISREAACICMLSRLFSDSDIICENDLCEQRKCCTFVAVSGLMPDIVKQVADLLLCLVPWEQLLLPLGHQWEGSFVFRSKEEEKEISICFEKECKKKSRVFEAYKLEASTSDAS